MLNKGLVSSTTSSAVLLSVVFELLTSSTFISPESDTSFCESTPDPADFPLVELCVFSATPWELLDW